MILCCCLLVLLFAFTAGLVLSDAHAQTYVPPFGTFVDTFDSTDLASLPRGITANSTHVLVADYNGINIFDLDGNIAGTIGSFGRDNGQFDNPRGITTNSTHILVADTDNNRIQVFDNTGTHVTTIGNPANSISGSSLDGMFDTPSGITTNSTHILVADTYNHRIQVFDLDGNYLSQFGNDLLSLPRGITTNSTHILVTDTGNNRIHVFDSNGTIAATFGSVGGRAGQFNYPTGITTTSTHILVTDTHNDRIQVFDHSGNYVSMIGSSGNIGNNENQFDRPSGITTTSTHVLVADTGNARIQIFDLPPTVTISSTLSDGGPAFSNTISYVVLFSEPVTGFMASDITISGTASVDPYVASNFGGTADRYTFEVVTPSVDTVTVSIPENTAEDNAGNGNVASDQHTIAIDIVAPTVSLTTDVTYGGTSETNMIFYTAAFDETVTGFDTASDITISGTATATASAPTGEGDTYYFTVTTTTDGTVTVSIPANAAEDNAGNGNVASDPYIVTVDAPASFGTFVSTIGSFGRDDGHFNNPNGITTNSTHILVADSDNNRIQVFHLNGTHADTLDSFGDTGDDGFNHLQAITTNSTHILVADTFHDRILIFDTAGRLLHTFGSHGTGDGQFDSPRGITTNSTHILVADTSNDRIQVFDNTGTHVSTFGNHGSGDGQFDSPRGITTNSTHILVTDSRNDRIQVFDNTGTHVGTIGSMGSDLREIDNPRGITTTPTHILVADTSNHQIQVFHLNGAHVGTIGSSGSGDGQFGAPHGITTNSTHMLVTEISNDRIQIFDLAPAMTINSNTSNGGMSSSETVSYTVTFTEDVSYFDGTDITASGTASWGSPTVSNFMKITATDYTFDVATTDDGTVTVSIPKNVAVGSADIGNVPSATHAITVDTTAPAVTITADVTDEDTVDTNMISYTATFDEAVTGFDVADDITVSGSDTATASAPTGDGTTYHFTVTAITDGTVTVSIPANAAEDNAGNYNISSEPYTVTVDAPVSFGTFVSTIGSVGGSGNDQFKNPRGITTNSTHILVADTLNSRIQVFDLDGTYVNTIGSLGSGNDHLNIPTRITTNSTHILVADTNNHRIQVFDLDGTHTGTFGSKGSADGQFNSPRGITTNSTHILVADRNNHRIQVFDNTGTHVNSFGSRGATSEGNPGEFRSPAGIATTPIHILVADTGYGRIQVFDLDGNYVDQFGNGYLESPQGITITPTHILVTDTYDNRIHVFDLVGNHLGMFGSLDHPREITTNSTHILVADTGNHRIQIFDLPHTATIKTDTHHGSTQVSETVSYTVTFTKDVSYFDGSDIIISGTASGVRPPYQTL